MKTMISKAGAMIPALAGMLLASNAALAIQTPVNTVPEPDVLALFGLGAVVAVAVSRLRRSKKKK